MKLQLNNRSETEKFKPFWKLNNRLFNNQWIEEEITWTIIKYLEMNESENNIPRWNAVRAILRDIFRAINSQRRCTKCQRAREKVLKVFTHQESAYQNHNEIPFLKGWLIGWLY